MIELSKRLQMVASLVPASETVADVGTDHGYLAVWLLQNGRAQRVQATDIHEGPLMRCRQSALEHGLQDKIETHLCDGLQFVGAEQAQTIVMAGMGGETMISILAAAPWTKQGRTLVLQPQSKRPELEHWLNAHGYGLQTAVLCRDAGKLYLAMTAVGGKPGCGLCAEALLLRSRDPLLPDLLAAEAQKLTHALRGMEQAARELKELRTETMQRLEQIQAYQKEVAAW